tara:strand:+ start:3251 stop:4984 length:1734 start_codon:yes stop_codon:yes gene_type:complete
MKKLLLTIFFIFTATTYSQELDEAYLASLPEDVRESVLNNMEQREKDDSPLYRRPSSMVRKPATNPEGLFDRFGANIFDMMQSSFMPVNEPNVDSSYILDFGDTLQIELIGQKNDKQELSILRDGSINIPDIGKVFLSGLSLESASSLIKAKLSSAYIGVEGYITLINIKDIQVLISGNAYNPGIYTLNGNSNLLHALAMAGGIDEQGSYRKIDLIRDDVVIDSVDLYDTFIRGSSGFGAKLQNGDSILVKPVLNLVSVSGAVNRPNQYELTSDENFQDLLNYANGFSPVADKSYIRVERLSKNEVSYLRINEGDLISLKPRSGDSLYVKSFVYRSVSIKGAVNTPGTYIIDEEETLSSIIEKAEGYRDNAYPFGGALINKKTLKINQDAVERLYQSFVQNLITKGNSLFASESLPMILSELKSSKVSGRVMADFDMDLIKAKPYLDTTLEDGDEIIIPINTQQVYIYGEINNPGTIRYIPNNNIKDYLSNSGGILDSGDSKNIFVVHPNGEVNVLNSRGLSFASSASKDILIYPGTVIYIPRKIITRDPSLVASIWAPIVSALATSFTALSVLDNQ